MARWTSRRARRPRRAARPDPRSKAAEIVAASKSRWKPRSPSSRRCSVVHHRPSLHDGLAVQLPYRLARASLDDPALDCARVATGRGVSRASCRSPALRRRDARGARGRPHRAGRRRTAPARARCCACSRATSRRTPARAAAAAPRPRRAAAPGDRPRDAPRTVGEEVATAFAHLDELEREYHASRGRDRDARARGPGSAGGSRAIAGTSCARASQRAAASSASRASRACSRDSASRRRRASARSRASRAAGSCASSWRSCCSPSPTCCCSTSRPTTSTCPRSSGSTRRSSTPTAARVVAVSHDRTFLRRHANRIAELARRRSSRSTGRLRPLSRASAQRRIEQAEAALERQHAAEARRDRALRRALPRTRRPRRTRCRAA